MNKEQMIGMAVFLFLLVIMNIAVMKKMVDEPTIGGQQYRHAGFIQGEDANTGRTIYIPIYSKR